MRYLTLILAITFFSCTQKQDTGRGSGLMEDDPALIANTTLVVSSPFSARVRQGTITTAPINTTVVIVPAPATLPASVELNHPPIVSQGSQGSCVACLFAGVRASENSYKTGVMTPLSTAFIYDQTKFNSDCGSGTGMLAVLVFLMRTGVCKESTLPYNSAVCSPSAITPAMTTEAANYKITTYQQLLPSDIPALKTALNNRHAIGVAIRGDYNFLTCNYPNYIWKVQGTMPRSVNHACYVVGYDDSKHAFHVVNSWGTSWGDQGTFWIDYDLFAGGEVAGYCYTMTL